MIYQVIQTKRGWVLGSCNTREFCGRDGYWTRDPANAMPFATRAQAEAAARLPH